MSRYIDADALLNRLPDDLPYKASVKRVLMQAPTSDVVEVVRCKDCKYVLDCGMGGLWCDHPDNRNPLGCRPTDFCNDGERKEK